MSQEHQWKIAIPSEPNGLPRDLWRCELCGLEYNAYYAAVCKPTPQHYTSIVDIPSEPTDYLANEVEGVVYVDVDPKGYWYWSVRVAKNVVCRSNPVYDTREVARLDGWEALGVWRIGKQFSTPSHSQSLL